VNLNIASPQTKWLLDLGLALTPPISFNCLKLISKSCAMCPLSCTEVWTCHR
jgi:hypothetical protein